MAESLFEELKRYVRFGDRDTRLLAAFGAYASPHFAAIAHEFYERIREHERAREILTGEEQIARLERSLLGWLQKVCFGPHDEACFEQTSKIGRAHVKAGLPQEYIFSAMTLIRIAFERLADKYGGADVQATREAITRALDLAMTIMIRAYHDDYVERQNRAEQGRVREKLAALGTLGAGLAHEMRNPLNGAQLHLSILERALRRTGADAESLGAVRVVADEIKRLADLVTEFLEFARPQPLTREPVVIRAVSERVLALTKEQAENAGVVLTGDFPAQEIVVEADPEKLAQVLLNLVQNAVEALTPSANGHVIVRARKKPRDLVLEVEDDGPGLARPDAPVFDAFYSTKHNGTGLGLAVAHRIVSDHGGEIMVESQPGKTVFRVTLPLSSSSSKTPARPAPNDRRD